MNRFYIEQYDKELHPFVEEQVSAICVTKTIGCEKYARVILRDNCNGCGKCLNPYGKYIEIVDNKARFSKRYISELEYITPKMHSFRCPQQAMLTSGSFALLQVLLLIESLTNKAIETIGNKEVHSKCKLYMDETPTPMHIVIVNIVFEVKNLFPETVYSKSKIKIVYPKNALAQKQSYPITKCYLMISTDNGKRYYPIDKKTILPPYSLALKDYLISNK